MLTSSWNYAAIFLANDGASFLPTGADQGVYASVLVDADVAAVLEGHYQALSASRKQLIRLQGAAQERALPRAAHGSPSNFSYQALSASQQQLGTIFGSSPNSLADFVAFMKKLGLARSSNPDTNQWAFLLWSKFVSDATGGAGPPRKVCPATKSPVVASVTSKPLPVCDSS